MKRAIKVRLYPTSEQRIFLDAQFGAVRFVYNRSLHVMRHAYRMHGLSLNAKHDLKPLLAVAKRSRKYRWLSQFDSIALQQACLNLDRAFKNFFDPTLKARYPRFKRKHGRQSSYHCTSVSVGENWIKIPKLARIKARIHREIDGKVKSITLSKDVTDKYYASILYEDGVEAAKPLHQIDTVIGVDMGLTHSLIESNGRKELNPRFLKRAECNLRRKQKALSRCKKGSQRRAKARLKLAKAHQRVANARADYQHKTSRRLVDENQAIVVETLNVKNMMKNRKLAKHIGDAAWFSLIEKIKYKAEQAGKHLIKIDQWFPSSKTHHGCGHKVDVMPLSVRSWTCPACGTQNIDRDINAALNIRQQGIIQLKAEGLSVSAH